MNSYRAYLAACILLCVNAHAGPIFRCVAADQSIVYQAKPCPQNTAEREMRVQSAPTPVPGERQSELSEARQNPTPRQNQSMSSTTDVYAQMVAEQAKPPCPRTYEDGGSFHAPADAVVQNGNGEIVRYLSGVDAAYMAYKALPTRTYLKNAGKWPKHCPQ